MPRRGKSSATAETQAAERAESADTSATRRAGIRERIGEFLTSKLELGRLSEGPVSQSIRIDLSCMLNSETSRSFRSGSIALEHGDQRRVALFHGPSGGVDHDPICI